MSVETRAEAPFPAGEGASVARTNALAIASLVAAFFLPIGAIVLGHLALGQIRRTGEQGRGLAIAGIIIGFAQVLIGIIVTIIVFVVFGVAATQYQYNP
jgi:peptidyl-prolyl cis-trans isomerase B (cyclophilin B)